MSNDYIDTKLLIMNLPSYYVKHCCKTSGKYFLKIIRLNNCPSNYIFVFSMSILFNSISVIRVTMLREMVQIFPRVHASGADLLMLRGTVKNNDVRMYSKTAVKFFATKSNVVFVVQ